MNASPIGANVVVFLNREERFKLLRILELLEQASIKKLSGLGFYSDHLGLAQDLYRTIINAK